MSHGLPAGPVVALRVAYDGSAYRGWQLQPDGPTVQQAIETALARVHGEPSGRVAIVGAGRTDTGVHALGQVATYRPPTPRTAAVLRGALDALLPDAIRVRDVLSMPEGFHAIRSAHGKIYRYRIVNRADVLPFESPYAWHVKHPLDVPAMRAAAADLTGRHDFAAFATSGGQQTTTVRHVRRLVVSAHDGAVVEVEAEADGFLHKMVRNLTGFLVDVGRGRRDPSEAREVLASGRRGFAGVTAPARGLCMVHVFYPPESGWPPAVRDFRGSPPGC